MIVRARQREQALMREIDELNEDNHQMQEILDRLEGRNSVLNRTVRRLEQENRKLQAPPSTEIYCCGGSCLLHNPVSPDLHNRITPASRIGGTWKRAWEWVGKMIGMGG